MNVAFTRARSKLIIIGSSSTLDQSTVLQQFFKLGDDRGWILRLPKDAHLMHQISGPEAETGVTGKRTRHAKENGTDSDPVNERVTKKLKGGTVSLLRDMCNEMTM